MNAALSKNKETVEFVWGNGPAVGIVRIYCYDSNQAPGTDPYSSTGETTEYARRFWKGLVESGFRRVDMSVPA